MRPAVALAVAPLLLLALRAAAEPPRAPPPGKPPAGASRAPAAKPGKLAKLPVTDEQRKHTEQVAEKLKAAIATGSTGAIATTLDPPLVYAGLSMFDGSCKIAFADHGLLEPPLISGFASCLQKADLSSCGILVEDAAMPDFTKRGSPPCLVRVATARDGRRLINSIIVENTATGGLGGGAEGDLLADALRRPPPPPPPAPHPVISSAEMRRQLVAGSFDVRPDRETQAELDAGWARRVEAEALLCFRRDGTSSVTQLTRESGNARWDSAIRTALRGCRIHPLAETMAGLCTVASYVYERPGPGKRR
jgi:hypothetical protein